MSTDPHTPNLNSVMVSLFNFEGFNRLFLNSVYYITIQPVKVFDG